ncbi:MAG: HAD family phosphatase, partial [Chitinophagales bacterium]|nr:HAD family phosphatase [Chitinophagales bacterium]
MLLTDGWAHVARQTAAKKFGLNYDEMDRLHDFIFNVYEIGRITLSGYLNTVVCNVPRNFTPDEFKIFMFSQSAELPGTLQWLKEWKKNTSEDIRVISLNNEGKDLN